MMPYKKAIGLSIIVVELITNAIKYAYPAGQSGRVEIKVGHHAEGWVCLIVSGQGRGLPPDLAAGAGQGSLGMRVVQAMLDQINGRMQIDNDNSARFTVCT